MSATRRFGMLNDAELSRLMKLVVDQGAHVSKDSPDIGKLLGALAADVGFELWLREQARWDHRGNQRTH